MKFKVLSCLVIIGLLAIIAIQHRGSTTAGTIQWEQYTANMHRATINGVIVATVFEVPGGQTVGFPRQPGWHWRSKVGAKEGGSGSYASTLEQAKLDAAAEVSASISKLKQP